jgi:hypothetical protein
LFLYRIEQWKRAEANVLRERDLSLLSLNPPPPLSMPSSPHTVVPRGLPLRNCNIKKLRLNEILWFLDVEFVGILEKKRNGIL